MVDVVDLFPISRSRGRTIPAVLRSGSTSVFGHTYGLMTTSTPRSSEVEDVADLHGPQQHDGVVLKLEDQEVEAPQEDPQIQSRERGRLGFGREGEVDQPWGRGSGVQVYCALPLPSLYIEAGGRPRST